MQPENTCEKNQETIKYTSRSVVHMSGWIVKSCGKTSAQIQKYLLYSTRIPHNLYLKEEEESLPRTVNINGLFGLLYWMSLNPYISLMKFPLLSIYLLPIYTTSTLSSKESWQNNYLIMELLNAQLLGFKNWLQCHRACTPLLLWITLRSVSYH